MRWLIAGLLFALAVTLAVATAAIRASNTRERQAIDRAYWAVKDRIIEQQRLSMARLDDASPERLAELHWRWLRAEAARRQETDCRDPS